MNYKLQTFIAHCLSCGKTIEMTGFTKEEQKLKEEFIRQHQCRKGVRNK